MVEKFHESQSEIVIEEAGWPFNEFTNNIIVQLQSGRIEGDLIQTTPDLVLLPIVADGAGSWQLQGPLPPSLPPGIPLVLQAWFADAAGPAGYAASNALCATST